MAVTIVRVVADERGVYRCEFCGGESTSATAATFCCTDDDEESR